VIELVTSKENLNKAYQQVYRNKGSSGVDGMKVEKLKNHLHLHKDRYILSLRKGKYKVSPILGISIAKSNGKVRLLGIPTVTDRVFNKVYIKYYNLFLRKTFNLLVMDFVPNGMPINAFSKA